MSANDVADRLHEHADWLYHHDRDTPEAIEGDLRDAEVVLREQAEQLDSLRNAMSTCSGSCHGALAAAGGGVPEEGATDEQ